MREWEGFEEEGAELGLWLAELDACLAHTDHLTGSTCQELQVSRARVSLAALQGTTVCVCVCGRSSSACV